MIPRVSPTGTGLLAELRAYFSLVQADMARLLGVGQVPVVQAETEAPLPTPARETHGGDDKVVLEFKLKMDRQTATEATALVTTLETRQTAQPS